MFAGEAETPAAAAAADADADAAAAAAATSAACVAILFLSPSQKCHRTLLEILLESQSLDYIRSRQWHWFLIFNNKINVHHALTSI